MAGSDGPLEGCPVRLWLVMDQTGSTHLRGQSYNKIGSLGEFCCPKGKLGITRFSKSDFILSMPHIPSFISEEGTAKTAAYFAGQNSLGFVQIAVEES